MISSADYWATVFVIVSFVAMVLVSRRTKQQIQQDRQATRHAHTVSLLGDGERVVLAKVENSPHPYRVTDKPKDRAGSGRVYAFTTLGGALNYAFALLSSAKVPANPGDFGGVPLHHPSLDRRREL